MIPKLQNSQRFLNDYKNYQEKILKVTDNDLNKELTALLIKLKETVMYIDRSHEQIFITGRISEDISDLKSNIINIKKTLDQKLLLWNHKNFKPEPRSTE